jgi:hypothetical protein
VSPTILKSSLRRPFGEYTATWWTVNFSLNTLRVTVELPSGQALEIGEQPLSLSLHVPGHVVSGQAMKLTDPILTLPDGRKHLWFRGVNLFLSQ